MPSSLERVRRIMVAEFGAEPEAVVEAAGLWDCEPDLSRHPVVLGRLEREFGVEITGEAHFMIDTVGDLLDYLENPTAFLESPMVREKASARFDKAILFFINQFTFLVLIMGLAASMAVVGWPYLLPPEWPHPGIWYDASQIALFVGILGVARSFTTPLHQKVWRPFWKVDSGVGKPRFFGVGLALIAASEILIIVLGSLVIGAGLALIGFVWPDTSFFVSSDRLLDAFWVGAPVHAVLVILGGCFVLSGLHRSIDGAVRCHPAFIALGTIAFAVIAAPPAALRLAQWASTSYDLFFGAAEVEILTLNLGITIAAGVVLAAVLAWKGAGSNVRVALLLAWGGLGLTLVDLVTPGSTGLPMSVLVMFGSAGMLGTLIFGHLLDLAVNLNTSLR